jgi:flagellar M-ring protein FliF
MSPKMKFLTLGVVGVLLVSGVGFALYTAANKPVSLYQTNLTPGDIQEVSQRLNALGISYKVEGTKIMVPPGDQSRIVGLMISYGLPHWSVSAGPADGGGFSPKTAEEKRLAATHELEATLIDELRQVEFVADARVNIVQADEDSLERKQAKATVMLKLKPGPLPKKEQIQSILNLVASSVPGLDPSNVKVTDTNARVWNDGSKIAAYGSGASGGDDEVFSDEHIAIKKAYEKLYANKVKESLDKMLGAANYSVQVDADINFDQTKIETTQVGDPSGNGQVVSVVKKEEEKYNNTPKDGKKPGGASQQVALGPQSGDASSKTQYDKVRYEQKVDSSKVEKTAIIAPNVVKRLSVSLAVDQKLDDAKKASLASFVGGAMGIDTTRGDTVSVVDMAFDRSGAAAMPNGAVDPFGTPAPERTRSGGSGLMLMAMLVPTTILLSILTIFLLKQRRVQADRQGLVMTMGPGATTSDISDLLSDKIGRSTATTQTTRVNNTEQLEKLAKEKPTKVAELLKSTWLSDRER